MGTMRHWRCGKPQVNFDRSRDELVGTTRTVLGPSPSLNPCPWNRPIVVVSNQVPRWCPQERTLKMANPNDAAAERAQADADLLKDAIVTEDGRVLVGAAAEAELDRLINDVFRRSAAQLAETRAFVSTLRSPP